ncbi:NfeD family protein [Paenibacillus thermotolerans]|uniref:NfeD family protein n=1 Tax=Paenibacillus thermotolerans TaxID=3027807 RepID=UPI00236798D3|nr:MULTISPECIES: NfeD family protein [unclassified Paenibacillus]
MLWILWLTLAALFVLIELQTGTFYFVLLAVAAIFSMSSDLLGLPFLIQCFTFTVVTLLMYVFLLPLLRKTIPSSKALVQQTTDKLLGHEAFVIQDIIPGEVGMVKINGEVWSAISDEFICMGEKVKIIEVRVTKLFVKKE